MVLSPKNRALINAAQALVGHTLSETETKRLLELFDKASGTESERAHKALRQFAAIKEGEIEKRASASDNLDRAMKELAAVMKGR